MKIGHIQVGEQNLVVSKSESDCRRINVDSICDLIEQNVEPELADETYPCVAGEFFSWLAPIPKPGKIICIGRNYAEHALESGSDIPDIPVVFNKFSTALTPHLGSVELPAISQEVDFEAELVIVIGKTGRHIAPDQALDHVYGITCGNDISARDWQKGRPGGQWLLGKTFETFAPIGPTILTMDQVADIQDLDITLSLNGKEMQSSNTRHMIFPVDFLISHLSKFCTLCPGDLIYTGTPEGVGAARNPPVFLQPGDEMVVKISGCDDLVNQVVDSGSKE